MMSATPLPNALWSVTSSWWPRTWAMLRTRSGRSASSLTIASHMSTFATPANCVMSQRSSLRSVKLLVMYWLSENTFALMGTFFARLLKTRRRAMPSILLIVVSLNPRDMNHSLLPSVMYAPRAPEPALPFAAAVAEAIQFYHVVVSFGVIKLANISLRDRFLEQFVFVTNRVGRHAIRIGWAS